GDLDARVAIDRADELVEVADDPQRAPGGGAALGALDPQRQELVVVDEADDARRARRGGAQAPGNLREVLAHRRLAALQAGRVRGAGVAVDAGLGGVVRAGRPAPA